MRSDQTKSIIRLFIARVSLIAFVICALAAANSFAQKQSSKQAKAKSQTRIGPREIREAEELLSNLGYWTGPIDGRMDKASRDALIAFQKVEGRKITGRLTASELRALQSANRPSPREGGEAHVEVDLDRQVLFVVDGSGNVSKILPISSGNGEEFTSEGWTRQAITPTGRFKVHRKLEGWRKSPLGLLYYPNYFLSGVAIHGNPTVPTRPASHGCVRIPMYAAKEFSDMTPIGTVVLVYGDNPFAQGKSSATNQR
ncbi:MAG TPA: L,D-transpeptidase family protein [Blastocatellia bacterium]|nr:L,D-transpeptidase family protein [Blastocatellia bacterium]